MEDTKRPTSTSRLRRQFSRMLGILRRPLLGPLLFGMAFGGVPFGIVLTISGVPETLRLYEWLSPFTIVLAALSANLSVDRGLYRILGRAFCTSIAIWVPVPALVWTALARHEGLDLSDPRNLSYNISLLFMFGMMITIPSWVLSLVLEHQENP